MIDHVEITVRGGAGGNGCVSFRREKFAPRGGPDGGDGGNGGNVVLVADSGVNTFYDVAKKQLYKAGDGGHGQGQNRYGRQGKDIVLRVPVGTVVLKLEKHGVRQFLADMVEPDAGVIAARGGLGGWGNARFATSTYQAPRIAQRGLPGEEAKLLLELKLMADVGIIGLPNVGKSTLLTAISAARPKIADYPFTTLEPALGVVNHGYGTFVVADIPGLIEGAHRGAGLGLEFLRHIERTRILLHLLDGTRPDVVNNMDSLKAELAHYSGELLEKQQVVAVNKMDIPEAKANMAKIRDGLRAAAVEPLFVSALTGEGIQELIQRLADTLERVPPEQPARQPVRVRPSERRFAVSRDDDGGFRVDGETMVAFAAMMPLESEEGRTVFWQRLARQGVVAALRRAAARPGDRVRFGEIEVEWPG